MFLKGGRDKVVHICEDASATVLEGRTDPADLLGPGVLLAIGELPVEEHLFAFARSNYDC